MSRIEIGEHLAVDSRVCGGRLIFKGTRVLVADVLELLKTGLMPDQVAQEYRGLVTSEAVYEAVTLRHKGVVREVLPKTKNAA